MGEGQGAAQGGPSGSIGPRASGRLVSPGLALREAALAPCRLLGPTGLLKAGAVTTILFLSVGRDSDVQGVSLEFLYSSLFAFCR